MENEKIISKNSISLVNVFIIASGQVVKWSLSGPSYFITSCLSHHVLDTS